MYSTLESLVINPRSQHALILIFFFWEENSDRSGITIMKEDSCHRFVESRNVIILKMMQRSCLESFFLFSVNVEPSSNFSPHFFGTSFERIYIIFSIFRLKKRKNPMYFSIRRKASNVLFTFYSE